MSNLPLMIQQPNILGAMAQGTQNAANQANLMRQAEGQNIFRQYGAGAMQGDQNALNALAGFDPQMAQGMRVQQNQDRRAERSMQMDEERFVMAKEQARQAVIAAKDAAEAEAEVKKAQDLFRQAVMAFETGNQQAWQAVTSELGHPLPMDQQSIRLMGALVGGAAEGVVELYKPAPTPHIRQITGQEAAARGGDPAKLYNYNEKTGQMSAIGGDGLFGSEGISVTSPDGTVIQMGGAQQEGGINPTSPASMLASVDGLLNDPALDFATGWLAWTQNIPGTDSRRFGARVKQLEGQAFLQAFESLKGGGQITEIEGVKATQAIARLDTAQKPEDYRAALEELRQILIDGMSRPQGWAETQGQTQSPAGGPQVGVTEDGYRFLGGDPGNANNWQKVDGS